MHRTKYDLSWLTTLVAWEQKLQVFLGLFQGFRAWVWGRQGVSTAMDSYMNNMCSKLFRSMLTKYSLACSN